VPNISHLQITASGVFFFVFAAVTLISAIMVVTLRNLFHCALFLGLSFMGIAGLYVILNAEFLAVAQVLIYVGAITVLLMLAIMLTQRIMSVKIRQVVVGGFLGFPVAAAIAAILIWSFQSAAAAFQTETGPAVISTKELAINLLAPYLLPFELASVVLLVALVAAVVLAVEDKKNAAG
jgi:NADH-quinone oxidoreductase subunit J